MPLLTLVFTCRFPIALDAESWEDEPHLSSEEYLTKASTPPDLLLRLLWGKAAHSRQRHMANDKNYKENLIFLPKRRLRSIPGPSLCCGCYHVKEGNSISDPHGVRKTSRNF